MQVIFHFNVAPLISYAYILLKKAYASGAQIIITAPEEITGEIDQALWLYSKTDFIPHAQYNIAKLKQNILENTPIIIFDHDENAAEYIKKIKAEKPENQIAWVNLQKQTNEAAFQTIIKIADKAIELVGTSEEEKTKARAQWRQYIKYGITPQAHNAVQANTKK